MLKFCPYEVHRVCLLLVSTPAYIAGNSDPELLIIPILP